ncbi:hypothetical protein [Pseudomonas sp. NPDC086251]|uniref:hypothetical protein n=1 Tax=Pseudomonas sp. NPDC086251 TaxID=3364431 RepID=UPI0038355CE3
MYLYELKQNDLRDSISDSEYFTASEDEYYSADESHHVESEYSLASGPESSIPLGSGSSFSYESAQARKKFSHKSPSAPNPTGWTVDDSEQKNKYGSRKHIPVDAASMRNYYLWRRLITSGAHPRDAAIMAGAKFCYKQVKQKKAVQLFSIRLSQEHRVFFMIQEDARLVRVLNIGGHSFS